MKNPFKIIRDYFRNLKKRVRENQESRKTLHSLEQTAIVFETLNKFRQGGLLYVDFKHNTVTIAQLLANYYIYESEAWQNFLHQVHLWSVFQYQVSEYTRLYTKAQADAEAQAFKKNKNLTPSERKVIRMEAAAQFDDEQASRNIQTPDLQFVVLGMVDNEPMLVAKIVNGEYKTISIHNDNQ